MFSGIGCTIFVLNKIQCKVEIQINVLHPDNIHDIINKSDEKLIIYGQNSLCILGLNICDNFIKYVHKSLQMLN
jgi:hypothetical protein